jgi:hypothetical protein
MFNAKQTQLLNTLGVVSDADRERVYENYCEVQFELRANGMRSSTTFTQYLERKVAFKVAQARKNAGKILSELA